MLFTTVPAGMFARSSSSNASMGDTPFVLMSKKINLDQCMHILNIIITNVIIIIISNYWMRLSMI